MKKIKMLLGFLGMVLLTANAFAFDATVSSTTVAQSSNPTPVVLSVDFTNYPGANGIGSSYAKITWDINVLNLASVSNGTTFQPFVLTTNLGHASQVPGEVRILQDVQPSINANNGQILTLNFNVLANAPAGPTTIAITQLEFSDNAFNTIPVSNITNGTVTVNAPTARYQTFWTVNKGDSQGDKFNSFAWNTGDQIFVVGEYEGTYPNQPNSVNSQVNGMARIFGIFNNGAEADFDMVFPNNDISKVTDIEMNMNSLVWAGTFDGVGPLNVQPITGTPDLKNGRATSTTAFIAGINRPTPFTAAYGGAVVIRPLTNDDTIELKDVVYGPNSEVYVVGNFNGQYDFENPQGATGIVKTSGPNVTSGFIAKYSPVTSVSSTNLDVQWVYTFESNFGGSVEAAAVNLSNGQINVIGSITTLGGSVNFNFPTFAQTFSTRGQTDGVTLTLDSNGTVLSANVFGSSPNGNITPTDIAVDNAGDVVISALFPGTVNFERQGGPATPRTLTASAANPGQVDIAYVKYSGTTHDSIWAKSYQALGVALGTDSINGKVEKNGCGEFVAVAHAKGGIQGKAPAIGGITDTDVYMWVMDSNGNDSLSKQVGTANLQDKVNEFKTIPHGLIMLGNALDAATPANSHFATIGAFVDTGCAL